MHLLTRLSGRIGPGFALVLAWALISLGNADKYGTYSPPAITLVSAGVAALTAGTFLLRRCAGRPPGWPALSLAALVGLGSTAFSPAERYARGSAEQWSHGLLIAAALVLAALVCWPGRPRVLDHTVLGLAGAGGIAGIRATPRPTIDDFHILQGSAKALLHLHNIYAHAWPGSDGHLLPYLPGSAILLTPSYLFFSDVRYGLLAALLLAALAVTRLGRSGDSRRLAVLGGLMVTFPWVLYLVEQSWPEALLLALVAAMVWSVQRDRLLFAVICFGAALLTKQHAALLMPFAAVWPAFGWRRTLASVCAAAIITLPWVLADPHAFWRGAVSYNLNLPPRHDSLSLFTVALRSGWSPSFALVPLLLLAALAVGIWRVPRTAPGFVFGSAWLLAVFNLLNKQSFFNEWSFVIGLIVLGLATLVIVEPSGQRGVGAGDALGTSDPGSTTDVAGTGAGQRPAA